MKAKIIINDIKESNIHRSTGTDAEYQMNIYVTGDDIIMLEEIKNKILKIKLNSNRYLKDE